MFELSFMSYLDCKTKSMVAFGPLICHDSRKSYITMHQRESHLNGIKDSRVEHEYAVNILVRLPISVQT